MKKTKRNRKKKIIISTIIFLVLVVGITSAVMVMRGKKDKTYAYNQQSTISLEKWI